MVDFDIFTSRHIHILMICFAVLNCPAHANPSSSNVLASDPTHIRVVINDGPVALHGIRTCPISPHGLCPLAAFLEGQKETIRNTDWDWGCFGNWTLPLGSEWETTGGWYPPPPRPARRA